MAHKLALNCFVLLLPPERSYLRLVAALLISIVYLMLLLLQDPYRKPSSKAFAIGVALEPQLFEAGGSFYGKNLRHNYGFWPKKKVCSDFPVVDGAIVDSCTNNNGNCPRYLLLE